MKRRGFITLLGAAAAAWPTVLVGQQAGNPTVGLLSSASPELHADRLPRFFRGLADVGYVEGRNVLIEYRWAEGQNERLGELAADLVLRRVDVIATLGGTPVAQAANAAASSRIPIVFQVGINPVEAGLVSSLNRPDGNVTGVTTLSVEVAPKRLELLHELVPAAKVIGLLVNPTSPEVADAQSRELEGAAGRLDLQLHRLEASTVDQLGTTLAAVHDRQIGAVVIGADAFFHSHIDLLQFGLDPLDQSQQHCPISR